MFTPSELNSRILVAWLPAYAILLIHGAITEPLGAFIEVFILYPFACGSVLGVHAFFRREESDELIERTGLPYTKSLAVAVVVLILLPLSAVLFAMISAQLNGSYEDVSWVVIVFGGLIGREIGQKLRFLS
ncbi:MAG: hypothetical protein MRY76_02885 [Pseudomonadales bacterium]|nr:hypothetical protein [Pseudomonadales bacterium]